MDALASATGDPIFIPEIADYEVRRELLRARKLRGLARLDLLKDSLEYLPLTTPIMLRAAELWAQARQQAILRPIPTPWTGMSSSLRRPWPCVGSWRRTT